MLYSDTNATSMLKKLIEYEGLRKIILENSQLGSIKLYNQRIFGNEASSVIDYNINDNIECGIIKDCINDNNVI